MHFVQAVSAGSRQRDQGWSLCWVALNLVSAAKTTAGALFYTWKATPPHPILHLIHPNEDRAWREEEMGWPRRSSPSSSKQVGVAKAGAIPR